MAGVEKIKERILQESEQKAAKIMENAKAQAEEILKKAKQEAAKRQEELIKKSELEASDKRRISNSMIELEMRKDILNTKQSLIEQVFNTALERLASMEVNEYKAILENMMTTLAISGDEEVILSPVDKERLGTAFIDQVNNKLKSMGKPGMLKLAEETRALSGGFMLKAKGMEINNSFEALLKMHREEVEPKVAELLF